MSASVGMPLSISRSGAGACVTSPAQARQAYLGRRVTITFSCAGITSSRSETSSPMRCLRPPRQAQVLSSTSMTISSRGRCTGSAPRLICRLRAAAGLAGTSPSLCFGDLACDPVRGRMGCDVDPDKVSAGQPNDDKGIEQVEANGRNNEQVHGGDVRRVVTQEGAPALGRRSTSLDHVLRDARLSDLKAELEQLAMDARRTPQRIVNAHPPDQGAQVRVDLRPASKGAGFPTPGRAKAGPMPTHQGLWSDDSDGPEHRWKPSIQQDQEQAIPICELDATPHPALQHNQLMTERRVLGLKSAFRLERRDGQGQEEEEERDHRR